MVWYSMVYIVLQIAEKQARQEADWSGVSSKEKGRNRRAGKEQDGIGRDSMVMEGMWCGIRWEGKV